MNLSISKTYKRAKSFNLGDIKRLYERTKSYYFIINFSMITYLFVNKSEVAWWQFLIALVVGVVFVAWFDATFVHGKEHQSVMNKNPDWVKLCKQVDKISKKLETN